MKELINSATTDIFLDSGNPDETKAIFDMGLALNGQTTNPSLVVQNKLFQNLATSGRVTLEDLFEVYKKTVQEIRSLLPKGSISIEVYAGADSTVDELLSQAREMRNWIPECHIKLPITEAGLETASILVREGTNVNMTLCFTQEQALAVHYATLGAKPGQVFVSPFIGRLDDIGLDGSDLIKNIIGLYREIDSPVFVLAASIRNKNHLQKMFDLQTPIVTVPFEVLKEAAAGDKSEEVSPQALKSIPAIALPPTTDWHALNIQHDLTDKGLAKFKAAWDELLK